LTDVGENAFGKEDKKEKIVTCLKCKWSDAVAVAKADNHN